MKNRPAITLILSVLTAALAFAPLSSGAGQAISLAGEWRFALDRTDAGIQEQWFQRNLADRIKLPGALQEQGYGDDVSAQTDWTATLYDKLWYLKPHYKKYTQPGNVKIPFFLQPDKRYVGAAWYQREIEIPDQWKGRRVVLTLERPHWETRVWLDGREIGTNNSLSVPHVYALPFGSPAGRHRLTIRVDNRMIVDVGFDAHSVTDHTQGNWNGITGRIELSTTSPVWIEDARVYPDVARKSALLKVKIGNVTGKTASGTLTAGSQTVPVKCDDKGGAAEMVVPLGDKAEQWDEFHPALQRLELRLKGEQADDRRELLFGLRQIGTEGTNFVMNGRKFFVRGTLECAIFPKTGYPPTDVESWRRIIRICKDHGLNLIRFHSWCPPEAAFIAADELGFYYHVECGMWVRRAGSFLGKGKSNDKWLYDESERIIQAYGNHPSFTMLVHGNEPSADLNFLAGWVKYWKERDPRRLYSSATGWAMTEENQFHATLAVPGRDQMRVRGIGGWNGKDYREAHQGAKVPIVSHEIGQFTSYPDFGQMPKYTGWLKPNNFAIFRDSLAEHGMLDQNRELVMASGRLQTLCYKEEIEAALRTPGLGGYELLDLHDFPGQGTALIGVLDAFWDSKGYVTPEEYRRFAGPTVPLARLSKRTWTSDEILTADVEVSHFGPAPLEKAVAEWRLLAGDGKVAARGELPAQTIPLGNGIALGRIELALAKLEAPAKYRLVIGLKNTPFENDWSVWLYPSKIDLGAPRDVLVASRFDDQVRARLEAGGRVLLFPAAQLSWAHPPTSFTPVFWNLQMFPKWKEQTLGILSNVRHPALAHFPTESYSEWNWADILNQSRAMVLDDLPRGLRPLVQVIDDWNRNRRLGLIFECRIGSGRLLVCSADLPRLAERQPAARQLYRSLLDYLAGDRCRPEATLTFEQIGLLLADTDLMTRLGAQILPAAVAGDAARGQGTTIMREDAVLVNTSAGRPAENLLDGNPGTSWLTPGGRSFPLEVAIEFPKPLRISGIRCLPTQDSYDGAIREYAIQVSEDLRTWREAARGVFEMSLNERRIPFAKPETIRAFKVIALSGYGERPLASLAELSVIEAK
jgi:hypothetical protein